MGGGLGEQAFVVALQQGEGLRVAADDVDQAAPGIGSKFGRASGFADQRQRGLQLASVGLQPLAIEGITARQVFAQDAGSPLAEAHAFGRLDAVADTDDDVEVEEADRLVGACNVQILHIAFALQLTLREHIADMATDDRTVATEQRGHLFLPQPNVLSCHAHFDRPGAGGVDDDLAHSANSPSIATMRADTAFSSTSISCSSRGGSNT